MENKYNKLITAALLSISIFVGLCSCSSSDEEKRQKALFKFEQNLSALIKNHDTTTFLETFVVAEDVPEAKLEELKEMSFIYEYTPNSLKNAIEKKTAIYGRIFSGSDNSIASFLPSDGNYNVNITMLSYNENYVATLTYGNADYIEVNSIEFVLVYVKNKWKILTINFFEI